MFFFLQGDHFSGFEGIFGLFFLLLIQVLLGFVCLEISFGMGVLLKQLPRPY